MNKKEFLQQVATHLKIDGANAALSNAELEDGTRIVMSILSHRITPDEAGQAAAQMPEDVRDLWDSDTWITNFFALSRKGQLRYKTKAELFSLVQNELEKQHISIGAEKVTAAVIHTLKEALSPGESGDVVAQLPGDLVVFWEEA